MKAAAQSRISSSTSLVGGTAVVVADAGLNGIVDGLASVGGSILSSYHRWGCSVLVQHQSALGVNGQSLEHDEANAGLDWPMDDGRFQGLIFVG